MILIYNILFEGYRPKTFDWNTFVKLTSYFDRHRYARTTLPKIDQGGSRVAFVLSNNKVLKIPNLDAKDSGVFQNKNEWEATTNGAEITPKGIKRAYDYSWIVVELVKPLLYGQNKHERSMEAREEFGRLAGIPFTEFRQSIMKDLPTDNEFVKKVKQYVDKFDYHDLLRVDHWGVSGDGRLVFLDPGIASIRNN